MHPPYPSARCTRVSRRRYRIGRRRRRGWAARALLGLLPFVLSCSLDDHPLLGWNDEVLTPRSSDAGAFDAGGRPQPTAAPADAGSSLAARRDAAVDASTTPAKSPNMAMRSDGGTDADAGPVAKCQAGHYLLELQCTLGTEQGMTTSTTLDIAAPDPQTDVAGATGHLQFTYLNAALIGDLMGQLDCATEVFHADILNGNFQDIGLPAAPFTGSFDGQYNPTTQTFGGSWSYGLAGGPMCTGTWSGTVQR